MLVECGKMLEKGGYVIKSLNTINFRKSMHYNPFSYIRSEKDILKLVNTIIVNTKGDGDKSGEDFWVKAEKLYYTALIGYIWYEAPDHEKNFTTLLEMINASEAREDDVLFSEEIRAILKQAVRKMPKMTRNVFLLSRIRNMTYSEIAAELGISVSHVNFEIRRALNLMRFELKDYLPAVLITLILSSRW